MNTYNDSESLNFSMMLDNITTNLCKPFTAAGSISSQAIMTTSYCVLLILSLGGNALVTTSFIKRIYQNRTPVDYFIVNMAISDLFVPLFTIPRRIQEIYLGWSPWIVGGVIGDLLCRVVNFSEEVSIGVSMLSMIFIAVERCWSILYPFKSPLITRETSPRFLIFSWFFSILSFSFYFAAYRLTSENGRLYCRYALPQVFTTWQDLWRADRIMVLSIYVAVPFVILSILYTITIVSLHCQQRRAINFNSSQQLSRAIKSKRVAIMLVVVLCVFVISWTPHYIYFFVQYYPWPSEQRWSCSSIQHLYLAAKYMNYLYTALNPIIYYTFNERYRKSFKAILGIKKNQVSTSLQNQNGSIINSYLIRNP